MICLKVGGVEAGPRKKKFCNMRCVFRAWRSRGECLSCAGYGLVQRARLLCLRGVFFAARLCDGLPMHAETLDNEVYIGYGLLRL